MHTSFSVPLGLDQDILQLPFLKKIYKNLVIYFKIYTVFKFFTRVLKFDKLGTVTAHETPQSPEIIFYIIINI